VISRGWNVRDRSSEGRLRARRGRLLAGLACGSLVLAGAAGAETYGGGGGATRDCLVVFDAPVNFPASKPRKVRCVDGDLTCDADGVVNGVCQFPVAVCVNSTFEPRCTLNGVDSIIVEHALDNGDRKFDPEFQALQSRIDSELLDPAPNTSADTCTTPVNFLVHVRGPTQNNKCRKDKKLIRMTSESTLIQGKRFLDKDKLKLICEPAPGQCSPQVFFSGTFDRIQKQIFNASCALGGCHDSQSQAGTLLLEQAGSHSNLIDVIPENAPAAAAGWKRVTTLSASTGDPDTSYLFHKVTGDLDTGFGARMPLGQPKLKSYLIDVIELWIAAGAPETGWVPGTD